MYTLGIDIGTTTISAVILRSADGEQIEAKTVTHHSEISTDESWQKEQDVQNILGICRDTVNEMSTRYSLDAIGLTGQMHGIVYIDENGAAVSNLITWQDERGNRPFDETRSFCEQIKAVTGYNAASGFGLVTLFADLQSGAVPAGAVRICTIMDYIAMRLTGRNTPVIHASSAASFGLFSLEESRFDNRAIRALGIPERFLPEVIFAEEIIGSTPDGIPVTVPIGDNQASYLGSAGVGSSLLANVGTGSQISAFSDKAVITGDPEIECRPFVAGTYILVGASLCGGRAYALLRDLCREIIEMTGAPVPDDLFGLLNREAAKVSGEQSPVTTTLFAGSRTDPDAAGSITGITEKNFRIGHLAYSMMEGICRELFGYYQKMRTSIPEPASFVMSGNGLRNSVEEQQILFGLFGRPFTLASHKEEAAYGAAMTAVHAALNKKYTDILSKESE